MEVKNDPGMMSNITVVSVELFSERGVIVVDLEAGGLQKMEMVLDTEGAEDLLHRLAAHLKFEVKKL